MPSFTTSYLAAAAPTTQSLPLFQREIVARDDVDGMSVEKLGPILGSSAAVFLGLTLAIVFGKLAWDRYRGNKQTVEGLMNR